MDFIYQYVGWGTTVLEWVMGIVFVVHGWGTVRNPLPVGKLLGQGKNAGLLLGLIEVVAGIMIATGMGTFFGTLAVIGIMLGALYFKILKWKMPFTSDAGGWEFELLALAAALTLLIG